MRSSKVLSRWKQGQPALCTFVQLADPAVPELISMLGFDCIWIDLEHSPMSVETASHLMRAGRQGGSDILARPGKGEYMRMGRLLEAGATGILYPRCESAEEAREVVRWAKFAPDGERGYAGSNPDAGYGYSAPDAKSYVSNANRETFICAQIESPEALGKAKEIAAVPGIDLLFFGPGDFSVLSGVPGQVNHPDVVKACEQTAAAAKAAGKRFGTLSFGTEHAKRILAIGASLVVCGYDMHILKTAYIAMRKELPEVGFAFGRNE